MRHAKRFRILLLIATSLVYVASLRNVAFTYADFDGIKVRTATEALFMGATAVLGGGLLEWVVWLANPIALVSSLLFYKGQKAALPASVVATLLAVSFLFWQTVLAAENGRTAPIIALNAGYWLWLSSLALLTVGMLLYKRLYALR